MACWVFLLLLPALQVRALHTQTQTCVGSTGFHYTSTALPDACLGGTAAQPPQVGLTSGGRTFCCQEGYVDSLYTPDLCRCQPGWFGQNRDGLNPTHDCHCVKRYREEICSGHGEDIDPIGNELRLCPGCDTHLEIDAAAYVYEQNGAVNPNRRCKCDAGRTGTIGTLAPSTTRCSIDVANVICNSHGTAPPGCSPNIDTCPLSNIVCSCDTLTCSLPSFARPIPNKQCTEFKTAIVCNGKGVASNPSITDCSAVICNCNAGWLSLPMAQRGPNNQQCNVIQPCPKVPPITGPICGGSSKGVCSNTNNQPDPNTCICATGFGGTYCCPRNQLTFLPNPVTYGPVCSGHGTCGDTGICTCDAGFGGTYCCPQAVGQAMACGQGTCLNSGVCSCPSGFQGAACEIGVQCPSTVAGKECSGRGSCVKKLDIGDCIRQLRFGTSAAEPPLTQFSPPITSVGIWNIVNRMYRIFMQIDFGVNNTNRAPYQQFLQSQDGGTFPQFPSCYQPFKDFAFTTLCAFPTVQKFAADPNLVDFFIDDQLYRQQMADYVHRVFATAFPHYPGITSDFLLQATIALAATHTQPPTSPGKTMAEGMAALMCYELYADHSDTAKERGFPATYPRYPLFQCECDRPTFDMNGILELDTGRGPGGAHCGNTCPVGNNRQVCSGYHQGQFRGKCSDIAGDNRCICHPRFTGNACQFSLEPACFPVGSLNPFPCTHTTHGNCAEARSISNQPQAHYCNCTSAWFGPYCQFTKCVDPGQEEAEQCSNRGICRPTNISAVAFQCFCDVKDFLRRSTLISFPPVLPVGKKCEINGRPFCAQFVPDGTGKGMWIECSNHGVCIQEGLGDPFCRCDPGHFGSFCQFTACFPTCSKHAVCNNDTGICACKPLFMSSPSCPTGNRTCECAISRCGHGVPNFQETQCVCDRNWSPHPQTGFCTNVQCPLVVLTNQGEVPCTPAPGRLTPLKCPDINGLIPNNAAISKAKGCCVNTCPACALNSTRDTVKCTCPSTIAYRERDGICYSKCHGQPFSIVSQQLLCDCSALTPTLNTQTQFMNQFCEIFTCLNGGTQSFGSCTCPPLFSGPFCGTPSCGVRGLLVPATNVTAAQCQCFPPFVSTLAQPLACSGDTCGTPVGGAMVVARTPGSGLVVNPQNQSTVFMCKCADNRLIGPANLSCIALNCNLPAQQPKCAQCTHGGVPFIGQHKIKCDCTGLLFTGTFCEIIVCLNGGVRVFQAPSTQFCNCPFPRSGTHCTAHDCLNGGVPQTGFCQCQPGWTGMTCQTAVPMPSSSTGPAPGPGPSPGPSPSSSTGGPGPAPAPASSSSSTGHGAFSSSSSSGPALALEEESSGLTSAQLGGIIGGTIAGAVLIAGVFVILAWQLGWGVFASGGTAAAAGAGSSASAAAAAGTASRGVYRPLWQGQWNEPVRVRTL